MLMEMFRARLRRVGNSLSVLVPKKAFEDLGVGEGDEVDVTLYRRRNDQLDWLREVAGTWPDLGPFQRERNDRY